MLTVAWLVILAIVLIAALLIWLEIDYGWVAGIGTAITLGVSYVLAQLVAKTPIVMILPHKPANDLDIAVQIAVAILVIGAIALAFVMGRQSGRKEKR